LCKHNPGNDEVRVLRQHLPGEPQHSPAAQHDLVLAQSIALEAVRIDVVVAPTVDFDRQPLLGKRDVSERGPVRQRDAVLRDPADQPRPAQDRVQPPLRLGLRARLDAGEQHAQLGVPRPAATGPDRAGQRLLLQPGLLQRAIEQVARRAAPFRPQQIDDGAFAVGDREAVNPDPGMAVESYSVQPDSGGRMPEPAIVNR
jgi:hypothetical protein